MRENRFLIHRAIGWTDGSNGSSTSPNGAAAYVIAMRSNRQVVEERAVKYMHGVTKFTSNDMEMAGILLCLQAAARIGIPELDIRSDSKWAIGIINGEFTLRDQKFAGILSEIRVLGLHFRRISLKHLPREQNARADWLCRSATGQKNRTHIPQIQW